MTYTVSSVIRNSCVDRFCAACVFMYQLNNNIYIIIYSFNAYDVLYDDVAFIAAFHQLYQ